LVCASKPVFIGLLRKLWTRDTLENTMDAKKIAVVGLLVAVVALAACRREEARPMKLGGPEVNQAEVAR
jgi:hypothetical protein